MSDLPVEPRELLLALFQTAVAAADPSVVLPGFLASSLDGKIGKGLGRSVVVIGAAHPVSENNSEIAAQRFLDLVVWRRLFITHAPCTGHYPER